MRKILNFIILFFFIFSFVGCSKNDNKLSIKVFNWEDLYPKELSSVFEKNSQIYEIKNAKKNASKLILSVDRLINGAFSEVYRKEIFDFKSDNEYIRLELKDNLKVFHNGDVADLNLDKYFNKNMDIKTTHYVGGEEEIKDVIYLLVRHNGGYALDIDKIYTDITNLPNDIQYLEVIKIKLLK